MKVKELIERLQSLDQELEVYVFNEKESSLSLVETVYKTCDFGWSEEWEDFVTIFPTTNPQPLFTLTAEEVEVSEVVFNRFILDRPDLREFIKKHPKEFAIINKIINRIKQWQDENNAD